MGRLYTKGLVDDIKTYGHPGRFSKVTKWTGGRTFFTSSTSASVNRGPGYGAGAVIISGSKSNFDQEAYIKMTGGGAILIKDLATTDAADAQSQMFMNYQLLKYQEVRQEILLHEHLLQIKELNLYTPVLYMYYTKTQEYHNKI